MQAPDLRRTIRRELIDSDVTLARVVRHLGTITYDRASQILCGHRTAREGELEQILRGIEELRPTESRGARA